jgi:hypothetical protein
MLGGIEVSAKAREHAREMLAAAARATPEPRTGAADPASVTARTRGPAARGR